MEKKIPVWFLILVLFIGINITVLFGWSVQHIAEKGDKLGKLEPIITAIAGFPTLVKTVFTEINQPIPLLIENKFPELDGFKKKGVVQQGAINDNGYLLLSVYNQHKEQFTVQLMRISDQRVLHEWIPDIKKLAEAHQTESAFFHPSNMQASRYRIIHPLLLDDGAILFHGDGPLFKVNSCSNIEWGVDGLFHHSIEHVADESGSFWVPSVLEPSSFDHKIYDNYRDDAITKISADGKILFKKSVSEILQQNGYHGLLFGAGPYDMDAIHLNDIQPAYYSTQYWQKGDLLISMRNRSAIFIYRPSTDKITWLKTGPWLNQHDPDFIGQSKISIFGNDAIGYAFNNSSDRNFVSANGYNNIYLFDFNDKTIYTPYSKILKEFNVNTLIQGRQEHIVDDDIFVEETENGRLLRLSPEKMIWEFAVKVDKKLVGRLSWSRYLTAEQVKNILPVLKKSNCS